MHITRLDTWQHRHEFYIHNVQNERNTLRVVILTVVMMVVEIAAGSIFGSMALLADGWHMGTHAGALGITLIAYVFSRRLSGDRRFTFGTGKIGVLSGFSSAIVLMLVALLMAIEAGKRLFSPLPILYNEAILVALIGLCVNLFSAFLLKDQLHSHAVGHSHGHEHESADEHQSADAHADHNIKAAYLHVIADALTSVLAIAALLAGKTLGWVWMDALMGMVGAVVITRWSIGLMRDTGRILLDQSADERVLQAVQHYLETDMDNRVCDLHVWKIGSNQYAGTVSLVTQFPQPAEHYRSLLAPVSALVHVTIEVHRFTGEPCTSAEKI